MRLCLAQDLSIDNKKRGLKLYLLSTYRQTRCNQTSKSPRIDREHQLLLQVAVSKLAILDNRNIS